MHTEQNDTRIRISQLSNGLHEYHFSPAASGIGLGSNFQRSVVIDATIEKSGRQLYLQADVRTSGLFQCDRCVEEFEHNVSASFSVLYVYDGLDAGRSTDDEVRVISPETPQLDLADDIRETVMLSVPLKLLCKENCKGLCPHCGVNLNRRTCSCEDENVDGRWESLENFIDQ
ncbi:MAG: DUF177 domain-containing protein [Bacteroidota bacterium]|jgi:uncharacterized protein